MMPEGFQCTMNRHV